MLAPSAVASATFSLRASAHPAEGFCRIGKQFPIQQKGHRNNRWPINHILYLEVNSCMLGFLFLIVIILTRKNCVKNDTNKRANSKT